MIVAKGGIQMWHHSFELLSHRAYTGVGDTDGKAITNNYSACVCGSVGSRDYALGRYAGIWFHYLPESTS